MNECSYTVSGVWMSVVILLVVGEWEQRTASNKNCVKNFLKLTTLYFHVKSSTFPGSSLIVTPFVSLDTADLTHMGPLGDKSLSHGTSWWQISPIDGLMVGDLPHRWSPTMRPSMGEISHHKWHSFYLWLSLIEMWGVIVSFMVGDLLHMGPHCGRSPP